MSLNLINRISVEKSFETNKKVIDNDLLYKVIHNMNVCVSGTV